MYEDMMKDMQEKMKPVTEMAEVNKTTAEKLISLQSEYLTDLFNSGLAQMKALSEVKEPQAAFELQVKYFKDLEAKLTNVAEQELAALATAKEQLTELVEKSVSEMNESPVVTEMTKMMHDAQEKFEEATKAFTPEAAAPAPAKKPAAKRKTEAAA